MSCREIGDGSRFLQTFQHPHNRNSIMNAIFFAAAILALGMQDVETSPESATQLYVKTVPTGAQVAIDGAPVGKSDKLFNVTAGAHKVSLSLEGYVPVERSVKAAEGEITRLEVEMKHREGMESVLSYVGDASNDKRSFADSGHAVMFQHAADMKSIVAVKLYCTRYGYPQPPRENFHIYLLDQNQKVLEQIAVPYGKIKRGQMEWQTIEFPAIEVPDKFMVALWFNAEATKGVFVGVDKNVTETHSYGGLPDKGFHKVEQPYEWMIRAVVSSEEGKQPTHPKVKTYEDEKADDTESAEAQPEENGAASRTWNDSTGAFSLEASFAGVEDGKVKLKKASGKTLSVPLEKLSKEDQDYVAAQSGAKTPAMQPAAARESRELSNDNGTMSGKRSIAGGGHAVKFKVEGNSNYVTSVSLHGSRYGMPQPPREDFHVWICNANFKPIATFKFRYSAFTRGNPDWKKFTIKPTKVPEDFIVCFAFNPQQTKGVFVSHDNKKPSETSLVGIPGRGEPEPFTEGNWLIRCKVEKR
jgi:hypothetical protein